MKLYILSFLISIFIFTGCGGLDSKDVKTYELLNVKKESLDSLYFKDLKEAKDNREFSDFLLKSDKSNYTSNKSKIESNLNELGKLIKQDDSKDQERVNSLISSINNDLFYIGSYLKYENILKNNKDTIGKINKLLANIEINNLDAVVRDIDAIKSKYYNNTSNQIFIENDRKLDASLLILRNLFNDMSKYKKLSLNNMSPLIVFEQFTLLEELNNKYIKNKTNIQLMIKEINSKISEKIISKTEKLEYYGIYLELDSNDNFKNENDKKTDKLSESDYKSISSKIASAGFYKKTFTNKLYISTTSLAKLTFGIESSNNGNKTQTNKLVSQNTYDMYKIGDVIFDKDYGYLLENVNKVVLEEPQELGVGNPSYGSWNYSNGHRNWEYKSGIDLGDVALGYVLGDIFSGNKNYNDNYYKDRDYKSTYSDTSKSKYESSTKQDVKKASGLNSQGAAKSSSYDNFKSYAKPKSVASSNKGPNDVKTSNGLASQGSAKSSSSGAYKSFAKPKSQGSTGTTKTTSVSSSTQGNYKSFAKPKSSSSSSRSFGSSSSKSSSGFSRSSRGGK